MQLYAFKTVSTNELIMIAPDHMVVIAQIMVEGAIKGIPTKREAFIIPGFPPMPTSDVWADPVDKWPDHLTKNPSKLSLFNGLSNTN